MITSFRCKETEKVFNGLSSYKFPQIARVAKRKLDMLHAVRALNELRQPPSNQLEAMKHERAGQHCIRVSDRWRLCFIWENGNATQVELVDYH